VNVPAPLRPVRRLWPQKVRTRLTLLYAALFFAAGSALLGLTYGLVASSLPVQTAATVSNPKLNNLNKECKPPKGVTIPESLLRVCKEAEAAYTHGAPDRRPRRGPGSACPSPAPWSPRTARPSPPAASPPAASTSQS